MATTPKRSEQGYFMTDQEKPKRLSRTENAAYVIEQLRNLGFDPNPSSRLMQMYRVWERGPHAFGTADFWIALEFLHPFDGLLNFLGRHFVFFDDSVRHHCCNIAVKEIKHPVVDSLKSNSQFVNLVP